MAERVLVTGGAGYVGCVLVPMLLEAGYEVTVYDSFRFGAAPVLGFSRHPRVHLVRADIRDAAALREAVRGHDWVLHLAAIVGYPACTAFPLEAASVNIDGTRNVVDAMSRGQRLVLASTGSTYGKVEAVATEETPIAPLTLYGSTKRDAEAVVQASDIEHVILRFATVFGSSPRMRLDLLVNDFAWQALHSRQLVLFEGHFRRTFLHVDDAARVYPFTLEHFDQMRNATFNVGDAELSFTKREVAQRIARQVEFYLHEASVGTDPDQRDYAVDYSRLSTLGFHAKIGLDEGISELLKFLRVFRLETPMRNV